MKKLSLFLLLFVFFLSACGPSIKLTKGDPNTIIRENLIAVDFTYDNMRVGRVTEEEYVKSRIENHGQEWHDQWIDDRSSRFEPRFVDVLNEYTKENRLVFERGQEETEYIMIVQTYFIETGHFAGISNSPSKVSLKITFVNRNNPGNTLVEFDIPEASGMNMPDLGTRIQTAYAQAARHLGRKLRGYLN